MNLKVGFIGFGNMAQAIAKGLIESKTLDPENIYASAAHYDKLLNNTAPYGITACRNNLETVKLCDWLILAVKPYQIEAVLSELRDELQGKRVLCVAAGWNYDRLHSCLDESTHHISTIPNTPIGVQKGILVSEARHSLNEDELAELKQLFEKIALIEMVDTHLMSIAGTIAGCTPAYAAMFIEALGDAGVKHGLPRDTAYRLAAKMLEGTGTLYLEEKKHPAAMKDAVCSPGGTTIKGVAALEKNGFRGAVIEAIDAIESDR